MHKTALITCFLLVSQLHGKITFHNATDNSLSLQYWYHDPKRPQVNRMNLDLHASSSITIPVSESVLSHLFFQGKLLLTVRPNVTKKEREGFTLILTEVSIFSMSRFQTFAYESDDQHVIITLTFDEETQKINCDITGASVIYVEPHRAIATIEVASASSNVPNKTSTPSQEVQGPSESAST